MSEATVRRLIQERIVPASQLCKGAPWVIRASDLDDETVQLPPSLVVPDGRRPTIHAKIAGF